METASARKRHAIELFEPLGPTYDRYAALLSFGQDPRWRRFLVERVDAPAGARVLDVACGTGAVTAELVARGYDVTALDQNEDMLAVARRRVPEADFVTDEAERLPFDDGAFDALTVTYLLRYVDDPAATVRELARVVRPGGVVAMLEFGVPRGIWRPLWELWVRVGLPGAGRVISPGWHEVGRFLGGSIRGFHARYDIAQLFRDAGLGDVSARRLSVGGGVVVWGRRT
jgi:demethylmenaquinone methyltransferase/2-methoxy-6-polyprenyl-1,4-benzoquinol methylase